MRSARARASRDCNRWHSHVTDKAVGTARRPRRFAGHIAACGFRVAPTLSEHQPHPSFGRGDSSLPLHLDINPRHTGDAAADRLRRIWVSCMRAIDECGVETDDSARRTFEVEPIPAVRAGDGGFVRLGDWSRLETAPRLARARAPINSDGSCGSPPIFPPMCGGLPQRG
jgi:hypothetical protein